MEEDQGETHSQRQTEGNQAGLQFQVQSVPVWGNEAHLTSSRLRCSADTAGFAVKAQASGSLVGVMVTYQQQKCTFLHIQLAPFVLTPNKAWDKWKKVLSKITALYI